MLSVGKNDVFERRYTQRFREFAGKFGEFVAYERDRGARDIGLHLTKPLKSGDERLTGALCWFQLKGITAKVLSQRAFQASDKVKFTLSVGHLRYWYLQPMPTYLGLFIEAVDSFLVLNLQRYVEEHWGRGILRLNQKTATIEVPRSSHLDEHAFHGILVASDVREWARALGDTEQNARLCRRDYDLIWHIGTASGRTVEHRAVILDWQSKTRGEVHIQESPAAANEWRTIRNHWQYMLRAEDVERMYPYLELYSPEEGDDAWWQEKEEWVPDLHLANGDIVNGKDRAGEYHEYVVGVRLNTLGEELFRSVEALVEIGLAEIHEELAEWLSFAPWGQRFI